MMTSAVGPADVSVDRSTVNGQGSVSGRRAPLVSLSMRLTDGAHGSGQNREKKKGFGLGWFWAKSGDGPARGPLARLRLAASARPAAQQAGSGRWARWARSSARLDSSAGRLPLLPGLGWRFAFSSSSSLSPRWLLPPLSSSPLSDGLVPQVSPYGIRCGGPDPVRQKVSVRACGCGCPKGARGNASTAWPRRERDVAVVSREWTCTARPWCRCGEGGCGSALWCGCARTRGALVSQSRGVAVPCAEHRRSGPAARRGGEGATAAAGRNRGATGPCTKKAARRPEREWGSLRLATEGSSASPAARDGGKGRRRRSPLGLRKKSVGAVENRCRGEARQAVQHWVGDVVDRGAGLVELRCGVVLLLTRLRRCRWCRPRAPPRAALLLLLLRSSLFSSGYGGGGKEQGSGG
jgi:hypothetical protein